MIPTPITQRNYVLPLNETARQPAKNAAQYLAELGKVLIIIVSHVISSFSTFERCHRSLSECQKTVLKMRKVK